jgi:hypothetical protein
LNACELEPDITRGEVFGIRAECIRVARVELFENGLPPLRIIDDHEAPGLAQPDRGRKASCLDQAVESTARQRLGSEPANVPSPDQKLAQTCAEAFIEAWQSTSAHA